MGNARWTGVRLRDVLDRAGVKAGAVAVRFKGLEKPVVEGAPHFMKSLDIDHARDSEVMLAYQMNGEQLPFARPPRAAGTTRGNCPSTDLLPSARPVA
jgi:DMSO/TMAO reductase YedYZ molybdopterin-dependent catalytic subunit